MDNTFIANSDGDDDNDRDDNSGSETESDNEQKRIQRRGGLAAAADVHMDPTNEVVVYETDVEEADAEAEAQAPSPDAPVIPATSPLADDQEGKEEEEEEAVDSQSENEDDEVDDEDEDEDDAEKSTTSVATSSASSEDAATGIRSGVAPKNAAQWKAYEAKAQRRKARRVANVFGSGDIVSPQDLLVMRNMNFKDPEVQEYYRTQIPRVLEDDFLESAAQIGFLPTLELYGIGASHETEEMQLDLQQEPTEDQTSGSETESAESEGSGSETDTVAATSRSRSRSPSPSVNVAIDTPMDNAMDIQKLNSLVQTVDTSNWPVLPAEQKSRENPLVTGSGSMFKLNLYVPADGSLVVDTVEGGDPSGRWHTRVTTLVDIPQGRPITALEGYIVSSAELLQRQGSPEIERESKKFEARCFKVSLNGRHRWLDPRRDPDTKFRIPLTHILNRSYKRGVAAFTRQTDRAEEANCRLDSMTTQHGPGGLQTIMYAVALRDIPANAELVRLAHGQQGGEEEEKEKASRRVPTTVTLDNVGSNLPTDDAPMTTPDQWRPWDMPGASLSPSYVPSHVTIEDFRSRLLGIQRQFVEFAVDKEHPDHIMLVASKFMRANSDVTEFTGYPILSERAAVARFAQYKGSTRALRVRSLSRSFFLDGNRNAENKEVTVPSIVSQSYSGGLAAFLTVVDYSRFPEVNCAFETFSPAPPADAAWSSPSSLTATGVLLYAKTTRDVHAGEPLVVLENVLYKYMTPENVGLVDEEETETD